tara:strand:+ start:410 stop:1951 length:1542 start_codon:yes stop_codon:yes gene_type:complete
MAAIDKSNVGLGPSINWGELFAGLSKDIQKQSSDRKKKTEDSELKTMQEVNEIKQLNFGESPSYQDVTFNGLDGLKDNYYKWTQEYDNGEITKAELERRKMNSANTMRSWSDSSLNYDKTMASILEKQNSEDGQSYFGSVLSAQYAGLSNMDGRSIVWAEDGNGYTVTTDPETGDELSREYIPRMSNSGNISSVQLNLNDYIKGATGNWRAETKQNSDGSVTRNFKDDSEYTSQLSALTVDLLKDPRRALSVLNDNGFQHVDKETGFISTYEVYMTEAQKKEILNDRVLTAKGAMKMDRSEPDLNAKGVQKEDSKGNLMYKEVEGRLMTEDEEEDFREEQGEYLLAVKNDSQGNPQPLLNDKFMSDGGTFIRDAVNAQLGTTFKDAPRAPATKTTKIPKQASESYSVLRSGLSSHDGSILKSIMIKDYIPKWEGGKWNIYSEDLRKKVARTGRNPKGLVGTVDDRENSWAEYTTLTVDKMGINRDLYKNSSSTSSSSSLTPKEQLRLDSLLGQ